MTEKQTTASQQAAFQNWLTLQKQADGTTLNAKTIRAKLSALKDIQVRFKTPLFQQTDPQAIAILKARVLAEPTYKRYVGVAGPALDYYQAYLTAAQQPAVPGTYTATDFLQDVFMTPTQLQTMLSVLQHKQNLILKGAPGVGKTFMARRLAYVLMGRRCPEQVQMVQFHQSYSYEDFIEGFRPKKDGSGFYLQEGPFLTFAKTAAAHPDQPYCFIIDEINRGNMSKIFGELMMLIEADKRGQSLNLLYSGQPFSVPKNLYIIGMMNTADRSLALLDYALRRRFSFVEISPAFENPTFLAYLKRLGSPKKMMGVIHEIQALNQQLVAELGTGFQIGHSYFVDPAYATDPDARVKEVVTYDIVPQLYEYWFDDPEKAQTWAQRLLRQCDATTQA